MRTTGDGWIGACLAKVDELGLLAELGHRQDGGLVVSHVFHVHVQLGRLHETRANGGGEKVEASGTKAREQ